MPELPQADPADIVVNLAGTHCMSVSAPAGLSIQVRMYATNPVGDDESAALDENGKPCVVRWLVEPGAANADERTPLDLPLVRQMIREFVALGDRFASAAILLETENGRTAVGFLKRSAQRYNDLLAKYRTLSGAP